MEYIRFAKDYKQNKLISVNDSPYNHITDWNAPYFTSMYEYPQSVFDEYQTTNSLSGVKNVTTRRLWFDLDCKDDLSKAFDDGITLVNRLKQFDIPDRAIQLAFSGNKGLSIVIDLTSNITKLEVINFCFTLAHDLKTFDTSVYDPQRIWRLLFTKNEKSSLYKIPIKFDELFNKKIEDIKLRATTNTTYKDFLTFVQRNYVKLEINDLVQNQMNQTYEDEKPKPTKTTVEEETFTLDTSTLSIITKPRHLDLARWYLQNGFFNEGDRSSAFLCLASTYKSQGFDKEITYRMLKGVAELQAKRTNSERFPDIELYNNIVCNVYGSNWRGGTFSLKDPSSWLYQYVKKHNIKIVDDGPTAQQLSTLGDSFVEYCRSFFENRIYTGLDDLDREMPITAGSNVGILGSASAGKTALALNILENSSKQNITSVFASLDMSKSRLYEKMIYKVTGGKKTREQIFNDYIAGKGQYYNDMVKERFPNVYVFSKSGPNVEQIDDYIKDVEDTSGTPVRLLMIDYFERLTSAKSDDTAASKDVSNAIQDLLHEHPRLASITLVQPNKFSINGGPNKPLLSYTAIKGSSFLYQSFRQILSLWRPAFTPAFASRDRFIEMAILKNDLGQLNQFVYNWVGKTGEISVMDDMQRQEHEQLLADINAAATQGNREWE